MGGREAVIKGWQGVGFYGLENETCLIASLFYEVNKTLWLTQTERDVDRKKQRKASMN